MSSNNTVERSEREKIEIEVICRHRLVEDAVERRRQNAHTARFQSVGDKLRATDKQNQIMT